MFLAQIHIYSCRYDQGMAYHERALAVDPSNLWANVFAPTLPLYQGNTSRAEQLIKSARSVLGPDPMLVACEGLLNAMRGEKRKAEQLIRKSLGGSRKPLSHTHHVWHIAACTYCLLNKPAPAINLLKKCVALGLPNYPAFRDDPFFKTLQKEPQYLRVMSGLKKEWLAYSKEFGSRAESAGVSN